MALIPGARLGPYEIVALLGVGGMGEVYRATDTNLKRQVAIKVLPASVAVEGDSFLAEKPRLWSEGRYTTRPGRAPRSFDLHPDGDGFALAAVPEVQTAGKQDKVVFIFNFFDELRRVAPGKQ